jgi:hypothetical protein
LLTCCCIRNSLCRATWTSSKPSSSTCRSLK